MCAKPGETLGVAEGGLETALSAGLQHQIPVWACGDAGLFGKWQPPEFVKEVIIYGDNDANFAGHAAAYKLAHRLCSKGACVLRYQSHRQSGLIGMTTNKRGPEHENKNPNGTERARRAIRR